MGSGRYCSVATILPIKEKAPATGRGSCFERFFKNLLADLAAHQA